MKIQFKFMMIYLGNFFLLMSIFMLFDFNFFSGYSFNYDELGIHEYSFALIMMSFWIFGIIFLFLDCNKLYICMNILLMLLMSLLMYFSSLNLYNFYLSFEVSLLMIFYLIVKWGNGSNRLEAAYFIMFYTLYFSLPLLVYMFLLDSMMMTMSMDFLEYIYNIEYMYEESMYMYFYMSFFVKIPLFMFHGWLLKAHVEAPVFGSMILAAVLLKMGTYGLMRMFMMFNKSMLGFNSWIIIYSLLGSMILGLNCLRQLDMKLLVAYSSVVHMGMLISSMLTFNEVSMKGCYIIMIGHGLCSSGLFYLVNVNYKETNSRLMLINKGMLNYMPKMSLMWFLFCSSNMASPVSLNLVGEIMMLVGLIMWSMKLIMLLLLLCFFSFSYSLYMYYYIQHGEMNYYLKIKGSKFIDYLVLILHWIPLNLLFLWLNLF